ncbi:MAG: 1-acyl-sn-glycerol-3-phosphate acyltransferase [Oscillospiraceae bacterium]|nr:1-acyl-sn-glycerol-3-phosphate acyltransferase [Oscillospiraceae bacterium]
MLLLLIAVLALLAGVVVCGSCGVFAAPVGLLWLAASFLGFFLLFALLGFLFVLYLCKRVDQSMPQEEDSRFYRIAADLIVESALPVLRIRIKKIGIEKVPTEGRFLLVCNHCNDSDPIILLRCLRKFQLAFISKRENSTMFVIGPMMHKLLCQLINRENDREALKTILNCIQILKEDKASIAVFPEGGILSEDGKLHHFRPGVFKIAQKANVPIVVCTLRNTKDVVKNIKRLRPSSVELRVLEVIPAEELKGVTTVDIAHRCYGLMAADLGPDLIAEE